MRSLMLSEFTIEVGVFCASRFKGSSVRRGARWSSDSGSVLAVSHAWIMTVGGILILLIAN